VTLAALALAALLAACALSATMALAWHVQQRTGNSGRVDTTWSLGVGLVGVALALLPWDGMWPHWRQWVVAGLVLAWSLRLGLHIAGRNRSAPDDPRYRALAQTWGKDARRRMFVFLQAQALVGILLVCAIVLAARDPNPTLRLQDAAGVLLLAGAILGEAVADRQLRAFKALPANRGKICDTGLWAWSRHPNYFFEWLAWTAYPVIAIDLAGYNPWGWLALAAPACMYWVLVYASGIPPLEAHMLRARGDAYRAYQQRTAAFFPRPPRQA
jgi:steroid 5-alpha reductase family enzyme